MGIQDDLFDLNDHLEGGNLQDAWKRVVAWAFELENLSDLRCQQIRGLETAIRVLNKGNHAEPRGTRCKN